MDVVVFRQILKLR